MLSRGLKSNCLNVINQLCWISLSGLSMETHISNMVYSIHEIDVCLLYG